MIRFAAAMAIAALSVSAAQASAWSVDSYTIDPGTFHLAAQSDSTGNFALVVQCHEETGEFEIYIESPFDWEEDASYAPEVPAVFTIDGTEISDVLFHFDDRQIVEGIVAKPAGQEMAFELLLEAIGEARDSIGFSYFDRTGTFSTEGADDALTGLLFACI